MFKHIFNEFKQFVMRGNVLDMAVGIIIGGAFTKIVNSMVADVMMPPVGLLMGKVDFSNWFIVLKRGTQDVGPYASLSAAQAQKTDEKPPPKEREAVFYGTNACFFSAFMVFLTIRQRCDAEQ